MEGTGPGKENDYGHRTLTTIPGRRTNKQSILELQTQQNMKHEVNVISRPIHRSLTPAPLSTEKIMVRSVLSDQVDHCVLVRERQSILAFHLL